MDVRASLSEEDTQGWGLEREERLASLGGVGGGAVQVGGQTRRNWPVRLELSKLEESDKRLGGGRASCHAIDLS